MASQVRDRLYQTNQLNIVYDFNPRGGYDDRGYGQLVIVKDKETIASLYLGDVATRMNPQIPKDDIDAMAMTVARALVTNQWLIVGEHLTYEHFEKQMEPGFIGEFRPLAPQNFGDW